jgi:hypothetical protein
MFDMDTETTYVVAIIAALVAALLLTAAVNAAERYYDERNRRILARAKHMRDRGHEADVAWVHVAQCDGCPDCDPVGTP